MSSNHTTTTNPDIVNAILAYTPEDYLGPEDLACYKTVFSEEVQSTRVMQRDEGDLLSAVVQDTFRKLTRFDRQADRAFAEKFHTHIAELLEAYRVQAANLVHQRRDFVLEYGERNGFDQDAVRSICDSLSSQTSSFDTSCLDETQSVIFSSFTNAKLQAAIRSNTSHIREALRRSNPDDSRKLERISAELIAQKWILHVADVEIPSRGLIINRRGRVTLLGNAALTDLHTATPKAAKRNVLNGDKVFEFRAVRAVIEDDAPPLNPTSYKILNYLIAQIYRQNPGTRRLRLDHQPSTIVRLHTSDLMEMFGWNNRQFAQKRIREALTTCEHLRIETDGFFYVIDKDGKMKKKAYGRGNPLIISSHRTFRGGYEVFFDTQFSQYLLGSYAVDVPPLYFSASPNATAIIYKLSMHSQMNVGKSNEHLISIQSLMEACPELDPSDRHTNRLVERLDSALQEIDGPDVRVEYRDTGGQHLTLADLGNRSRQEILKCDVWFEFARKGNFFTILGSSPTENGMSESLLPDFHSDEDSQT